MLPETEECRCVRYIRYDDRERRVEYPHTACEDIVRYHSDLERDNHRRNKHIEQECVEWSPVVCQSESRKQ